MNNISKESYYKGFIAGYRAGIKAAYSGKIAEPDDVTVLEIPVNGSGLSALACNALHRAGCTYIADVVKATEREISMMRNVGKKTGSEIAHWLDDHGICYSAWSIYL